MLTDAQLQRAAIDALAREAGICPGAIGVSAQEGVVTLSGYVSTYPDKCGAVEAVARVEGVNAVADEIRVRVPSPFGASDSGLAGALVRSMTRELRIPPGDVRVTVQDGWITLRGHLPRADQRSAVEGAARALFGATGVSNLIEVATPLGAIA